MFQRLSCRWQVGSQKWCCVRSTYNFALLTCLFFLMGCAQAEPVQVSTQTPTQLPHTAAPTEFPPATATPVATLRPPNTPTPASTSVPVATDVPTTAPTATDLPPTNTPNPDYEIEIAAVGDIMLDRRLGDALVNGDLAYPFELMRPG